jgi:hypothetical protein
MWMEPVDICIGLSIVNRANCAMSDAFKSGDRLMRHTSSDYSYGSEVLFVLRLRKRLKNGKCDGLAVMISKYIFGFEKFVARKKEERSIYY